MSSWALVLQDLEHLQIIIVPIHEYHPQKAMAGPLVRTTVKKRMIKISPEQIFFSAQLGCSSVPSAAWRHTSACSLSTMLSQLQLDLRELSQEARKREPELKEVRITFFHFLSLESLLTLL